MFLYGFPLDLGIFCVFSLLCFTPNIGWCFMRIFSSRFAFSNIINGGIQMTENWHRLLAIYEAEAKQAHGVANNLGNDE